MHVRLQRQRGRQWGRPWVYVNLRTDQRYTENTSKVKWVQMGRLEMFSQSPGSPGSCPDLFCCMCSWGLEPFRPHSCRLPVSCVYHAVQCSQVPGIQDADVLLSLETEASSSPQVVGPLMQSPLPSEEPSPYIISSDWSCGKMMGAQCS